MQKCHPQRGHNSRTGQSTKLNNFSASRQTNLRYLLRYEDGCLSFMRLSKQVVKVIWRTPHRNRLHRRGMAHPSNTMFQDYPPQAGHRSIQPFLHSPRDILTDAHGINVRNSLLYIPSIRCGLKRTRKAICLTVYKL